MRPAGELRDERLREAARDRGRPEPLSLAQRLAALPAANRERILSSFTPADFARLQWDWRFWARPTQLAPVDPFWVVWLILCGRGWGKTRTGAEAVRECIERGTARSIGLIGPSLNDVWRYMVFGTPDAPGLTRVFPPSRRIEVRRSDRQVIFHLDECETEGCGCGCPLATVYTAEEPELRGPNMDLVWCDELAKWRYLRAIWDNLEMTMRSPGAQPPRIIVTTTPRPLDLIRELLDDPEVRVTWGSMFANAANLHPSYVRRMQRKYANSRQGSQELFGALLDDNPDAMFHSRSIQDSRVDAYPPLRRIVVSVDPAISKTDRSDIIGIVVMGEGENGELYVLADLSGVEFKREGRGLVYHHPSEPIKHGPEAWGELVVRAYHHFHADSVIGERNRGGDLVGANTRAAAREYAIRHNLTGVAGIVKYEDVLATRGKQTRAEPVATLYEQGRVHHVGILAQLEDEMTGWNPKSTPVSPNRLDALVWGAHALANFGADPQPTTNEMGAGLMEANRRLRGPRRWDSGSSGGRERLAANDNGAAESAAA